ncbi:hypothetical protein ACFV0R_31225 [Streptomyces sp. NPDC059578]|uniref:hypothetical protein n=1 Tax=unclassified Streptomyces TaxID=2593676 RepID=UPI00365C9923
MFAYELHRLHIEDLHREADRQRLVRAALRLRRERRTADEQQPAGRPGPVGTRGQQPERFTRAA